jgi:hypothetical protein
VPKVDDPRALADEHAKVGRPNLDQAQQALTMQAQQLEARATEAMANLRADEIKQTHILDKISDKLDAAQSKLDDALDKLDDGEADLPKGLDLDRALEDTTKLDELREELRDLTDESRRGAQRELDFNVLDADLAQQLQDQSQAKQTVRAYEALQQGLDAIEELRANANVDAAYIDARMDELGSTYQEAGRERRAHGPGRHGPDVTDQQLIDRLLFFEDPDPASSGAPARCGRHATRIDTAEDYVLADDRMRASEQFEQQRALAELEEDRMSFSVRVPLEEILGSGYQDRVTGRSLDTGNGLSTSAARQAGSHTETDFEGGYMIGRYRLSDEGDWITDTTYPDPRRPEDDLE